MFNEPNCNDYLVVVHVQLGTTVNVNLRNFIPSQIITTPHHILYPLPIKYKKKIFLKARASSRRKKKARSLRAARCSARIPGGEISPKAPPRPPRARCLIIDFSGLQRRYDARMHTYRYMSMLACARGKRRRSLRARGFKSTR